MVYHTIVTHHFEEEVQFYLALVQNIRSTVSCFRNRHNGGVIAELISLAYHEGSLIHVHQSPQRDTAVYNVLTIVTSVEPTASYVNGLAVGRLGGVDVNPLVCDVSVISRPVLRILTSQSLLAAFLALRRRNVLVFSIHCTVLIEVVQCIGQHALVVVLFIQVLVDVKTLRSLAGNSQGVALAFCSEICEVDLLGVIPGTRLIILGVAVGSAAVNNAAACVLDLVVILGSITFGQNNSCNLLTIRIVTNLVYFNAGRLISCLCLIVCLVIGHIDECQVIEQNNGVLREAVALCCICTLTAHVEGPLCSTLNGLVSSEFISNSGPLVCRIFLVIPSIPALTVVYLVAGLGSALQLVFQLCLCQTFFVAHAQLFTVAVPQFLVVVGHITQLCVHVTAVRRLYAVGDTIGVTAFNGQVSVTELAVPAALTAVGSTADIFQLDRIDTVGDIELHDSSCVFTNVPRQALSVFEGTFAQLLACERCHRQCSQTCSGSRNCHHCSRSEGKCLLAEFFLQHKYPP